MTKPKRFLTSDLHLCHQNVLTFCERPFKNIQKMEDALIANWNSVVSPEDIVYDLGDVCFHGEKHKEIYSRFNDRINGRHILILGNHDIMKPFKYTECGFESVHTSLIVDDILLIHDPTKINYTDKNTMCFCGHVHKMFTKLSEPFNILNIGCDIWNYTPINWDLAVSYLKYRVADIDITLEDAVKIREKNIIVRREENKKDSLFIEELCDRKCPHISISKRVENFYCFKYYKNLILQEPDNFTNTKIYRTRKCLEKENKNGTTCQL